ncbi:MULTISPECIES: RHS repeat domain-containing protein [unclassified Gilliamella]|uniref:RHS repeat domain-containing protein n=1 Tax=unclassified Gilliamella TaxID=2685620 RepID=UPI003A5CE9BC|nr:hypothetical protein [Gilliamella sp. B3791]
MGRFTQPDSIGLLAGFNLYQYAPNGLIWIDPLGFCCGLMVKKIKDLLAPPSGLWIYAADFTVYIMQYDIQVAF